MAASAVFSLYRLGWRAPDLIWPNAAVYFAGAGLSWPLARYASRLLAPTPGTTRRYAASMAFHAAATVGMTAIIFAFVFRAYFAQWHGEFLSMFWIYNFIFTMAGAVYTFLVLGLPMQLHGFSIALAAYILWIVATKR